MSYQLYSDEGYVAELASNTGLTDAVRFVESLPSSPELKRLFEQGYSDKPSEVAKEINALDIRDNELAETLTGLSKALKKIEVVAIISQEGPQPTEKLAKYSEDQARDEHGRWTAGAGEGEEAARDPWHTPVSKQDIMRSAAKLKFPRERVNVIEGTQTFKIGTSDKTYVYAGAAWLSGEKAGQIDIHVDHVVAGNLDGVMAHEIEHIRYEALTNAINAERSKIFALDRETNGAVLRASGRLKDEYKDQFPLYHSFQEHDIGEHYDAMQKADGVSEYSKAYWHAFNNREPGVTRHLCYHETLAEMARLRNEKGFTPGAKIWKDYYHLVNNTSKKISGF